MVNLLKLDHVVVVVVGVILVADEGSRPRHYLWCCLFVYLEEQHSGGRGNCVHCCGKASLTMLAGCGWVGIIALIVQTGDSRVAGIFGDRVNVRMGSAFCLCTIVSLFMVV